MRLAILSQKPSLYSTSRLAEAGESLGVDVSIINHLRCKIIIERNKPQIYYQHHNLSGIDGIIPRIGASTTFYGAAVIRQFEVMGVYTSVSSDALLRARDKLRCLQILSRSGLNLPKTAFTNYSEDTEALVKSIGGTPLIIKLLEGTQGLGVVLAESKKAAQSVIDAFNKVKARIIVQEFVQESFGRDMRAIVVGDKVVAAMTRIAPEGEFRSNVHRGGVGKKIELNPEQEEAAIRAARSLHLDVAGVDMLYSERGPLIMEVNASPGLEGIEKHTGMDVAKEIISYVIQKSK